MQSFPLKHTLVLAGRFYKQQQGKTEEAYGFMCGHFKQSMAGLAVAALQG